MSRATAGERIDQKASTHFTFDANAAGDQPLRVMASVGVCVIIPMVTSGVGTAMGRSANGSGLIRLLGSIFVAYGVLFSAGVAQPLDRVTFATNWVAQAEHGGFYQAVVDGTYKAHGLDVTIRPGGPNVNHRLLLASGRVDFAMTGNSLQSFEAVAQGVPTVAVAAIFQKDPQVLIAHPRRDIDRFEDLKGLTLYISKEGLASFFQWMKHDFGFSERQVRPYTFNPQPFLADKRSAMQGYVTSEPFAIESQAGFKPKLFLLADQGFDAYSTLIETRHDVIETSPDLVQRFVDASIIGWMNYLYGDNSEANARIRRDNPEMTDAAIAYSIAQMKAFGIVDSGDTGKLGIGAMTDARMRAFFERMSRAGVVRADLDYRRSYTTRFVNRGIGNELRPSR